MGTVLPGRAVVLGMVDGDDRPGGTYGFNDAGHGGVVAAAELLPTLDAPGVGVSVVGGDLLARDEEQVVAADLSQVGQMADGVVLGDGDEVEPPSPGRSSQVGQAARAIGMMGVALQVTTVPTGFPAQHRRGQGTGLRWWRHVTRLAEDGQAIVASCGQDAVQAEDDVPGAGVQGTGQVARRGRGRRDGERAPVAAAPAPKTLSPQKLAAAGVETADVQHVAAAGRQRGTDRLAVLIGDSQPLQAGWHVKGQQAVIVGRLVVRRDVAG